GSTGLIPFGRP
uniref:Periviscerokinin-1 n=1 Tax=Perisphaeria virescens TaxID=344690 RepID=PVK1_PERVR|nr:RecName: Full=Periviscerokinin-1; Short=PerVi-PVK-1 [Perisphaeria virescens]